MLELGDISSPESEDDGVEPDDVKDGM